RCLLETAANAFPDRQIVLRPHPAERIETWNDISERCPNVHVVFEGNVIPWLLGAAILVHNGCTTAIESVLLNKPPLCYQPIPVRSNSWNLPNSISHQALSDQSTIEMILRHVDGTQPLTVLAEHRAILEPYADIDAGRLSSDRIVDVIESNNYPYTRPGLKQRLLAHIDATDRTIKKWRETLRPNNVYSPWHQQKQFPDTSLDTVKGMLSRLQLATGRFKSVAVSEFGKNVFKVERRGVGVQAR
ncbi:MAG TPA: surface carbohydrate biosynthesis protein, partial [Aestuariivirga sp.]|nr:surface carbohydrate biosynthesis protein [Aestuariivirga sp.]